MDERSEQARSFGREARAYEAGRPGYPAEAVEWLLEPVRAVGATVRVADVGAGTGKLTRVLSRGAAEVVAIDPDPDMLAALAAAVPGVPTFVGAAEALPLPDAAVDTTLFGQSWHWVDVDAASREAARVIRPGGVLGLVWNIRDERTEWIRRLTDIMGVSNAEQLLAQGGPRVGEGFGPLESETWEWSRHVARAELLDLVASRSRVITAPAREHADILAQVDALFDEVSAGASEIAVPYRTHAFRAIRLGEPA